MDVEVLDADQRPSSDAEGVAPHSGVNGPTMTSAEAERLFMEAVRAARYSQQQMEILRSVVIVDGNAPAEMEAALRELTPKHIEDLVRWLVRNNPGMLEAGTGNPFTFGLGSAVHANEMVPLLVRSLGVVAGDDE